MRALALPALCAALASLAACALERPEERPNGAPCVDHRLCESGLCLLERLNGQETGWTDGLCSELCVDACAEPHETCVYLDSAAYCLSSCDPTAPECRTGYVCQPDLSACLPDCRLGWDCGELRSCDPDDGLCHLAVAPGAAVGEACETGRDCATGLCLAEAESGLATGWSEGTCTAPCPAGDCTGGTCVRLGDYLLCVASCTGDGECRADYLCHERLRACLPDCRLGWDCGEYQVCGDDGRCTLPTSELLPVGAPCEGDGDCASGVCFAEEEAEDAIGWVGGTCAGVCGTAACGEGTGCVVLAGEAWCLPSCGESVECREGYVCSGDAGVCLPDCRLGWDCGASYVCGDGGECEPDWPSLAAVGEPCDAHADCLSGVCLLQFTGEVQTWFDGLCTTACSEGCPTGTLCASLGGGSYCLPSCAGQLDCPDAWVCFATAGLCEPNCQLGWACPDGATCNMAGLCRGAGP